jgi:death-on-curing protein
MNWRWLSGRIVTAIHLRQIQRHGGAHGVRDGGMLDSALARPPNLAAYGEPTVFDLAAGHAFGIARNHPFVDGNKRTAFVACALFLRVNGQILDAPQADAAVVFLRLAAGEIEEAELADWLRRHSAPPDATYLVPEQDA